MTKRPLAAFLLALLVAAAGYAPRPATAQNPPTGNPPADKAAPPPAAKEAPANPPAGVAEYVPPLHGAPGGRIGGASRGAIKPPEPLPTIDQLAPADHAGETISASPTLYYFVSKRVSWPMQLTISAPLRPAPVLEVTIPTAPGPGIYALRLADYRARLEPGIDYTWSVSIILDRNAWSRNIVASADIVRVEPSAATATAAAGAGPGRAAMFAGAGLWYDAVAAAVDGREEDRHAALDALLDQVGLADVARFDRSVAGLARQ